MTTDAQGPGDDTPLDLLKRWPRLRRWAKLAAALIAAAGVAGAGIGYVTGGATFFAEIREHFQSKSTLHTLIAAADDRLAHADYAAAWSLNAKALQLSPKDAAAAAQQLKIAMRWLEDVRLSSTAGPQTFGIVVDPLKAVLVERLPEARGRDKADIQAHIGWANFLRARDGTPATDVTEEFESALTEDPGNFYGHLMRGFWILWTGGDIAKAEPDLDIAMRSNVDPAFSDRLVMAGFTNITAPDFMVGALTHADAIRQAGRNVNDSIKQRLMFYYLNAFDDKDLAAAIDKALAPREQILLLTWLKQGSLSTPDQRLATYFIALNTARDGKRDEALQLYDELETTSADRTNDNVAIRVKSDIATLRKPRQ